MIRLIKKVFSDCLYGIDGKTIDPARLYGMLAVLVFLINSIYAIFKDQPWSATDYGSGFGILLAGFGAAVALKAGTEPKE